jgi:predicted deacylase
MVKEIERIDLGARLPWTSRLITVHRYATRGARPMIYLQAGQHADELPDGSEVQETKKNATRRSN